MSFHTAKSTLRDNIKEKICRSVEILHEEPYILLRQEFRIPIALFLSGPTVVGLVALELGKHGLKTDSFVVTLPMAVIALLTNLTVAFAIGMVIA